MSGKDPVPPFAIRPADARDLPAIAAVKVASWRETYDGLLPRKFLDGLGVPDTARRRLAESGRPRPGQGTFVLEDTEGTVHGYGSCGPQRTERFGHQGEIYEIYLRRCVQGQGLGLALFGALTSFLAENDCRSLSLWVLEENAAARGFYEGIGGVLMGRQAVVIGGHRLIEVAYGWTDLEALRLLCFTGARDAPLI